MHAIHPLLTFGLLLSALSVLSCGLVDSGLDGDTPSLTETEGTLSALYSRESEREGETLAEICAKRCLQVCEEGDEGDEGDEGEDSDIDCEEEFEACQEECIDKKPDRFLWRAPQHPFLAKNGVSNIHADGFMTDSYEYGGMDEAPDGFIRANLGGLCASHVFDRMGRLWTVCIGSSTGARTLYVLEADTLVPIASLELQPASTKTFSGGGYFFLDSLDRAVVATMDNTLTRVNLTWDGVLEVEKDLIDLRHILTTPGDAIQSAVPDWAGNIWFVTEYGIVGYADSKYFLHTITLGGDCGASQPCIANSFAVDDDGGVYVVATDKLYRFQASLLGPVELWSYMYKNSGVKKSGQVSAGSGTTPTLFGEQYVAIADNASGRMNVLVLDRRGTGRRDRFVCEVPVFTEGQSATENSLIAVTRAKGGFSLVVENNAGYVNVSSVSAQRTTKPGIARIDIDNGACRVKWTNTTAAAPSAVPKYSYETNLVYTYVKRSTGWYFVALDFERGVEEFSFLVGTGSDLNNHYAPVTIGPYGETYIGLISGLLRLTPY